MERGSPIAIILTRRQIVRTFNTIHYIIDEPITIKDIIETHVKQLPCIEEEKAQWRE